MRYLLISICLLLVACSSYPKKNGFQIQEPSKKDIVNPYFSDKTKDYVYKAKIDVYKKSFGGIFIIKKIEENYHRIVFTTEMGNKIFDFSFEGNNFKVNYILDQIDKKILINILKKDFKALIEEKPFVLNTFSKDNNTIIETEFYNKKHYYYSTDQELKKIVRISNRKEKVEYLFSRIENNIAKHIKIAHKNIKFEISYLK